MNTSTTSSSNPFNLPDAEPTFITTESAAKLLYTTAYTIRKYIRMGKVPALKIGRHYLISQQDLDKLLNSLIYKIPPASEGNL